MAPPANQRPRGARERPVCLVVLGMHRSGTSVLAGALGQLGADLPRNMMPPNSHNPKGFFEPKTVVDLHDEMLAALGSSWLDFRRLDLAKLDSAAVAPFKAKLVATLKSDYDDAKQFVVKDPRMCRFFPLWREVADSYGADVRVVVVIRNLSEVARSLAKRDGLSYGYSSYLWLRHILDAEFETRQNKRIFVAYADFMRDWIGVVNAIERELDITLLDRTGELKARVDALVDRDMRHHTIDEKTLTVESRYNPLALEAYRALKKLMARSSDGEAMATLDRIRKSFDETTEAFGLGADLISAQTKLYFAQARVYELETTLADRSREPELTLAEHTRERDLALADQANQLAELNAQLLALQDRNNETLKEIAALRDLRQSDQTKITDLQARHTGEKRGLERQVARLTAEAANIAQTLNVFREKLSRRSEPVG